MNGRATYSCTALLGSNKKGVVKPDADGYYNDLVLGALDFFNSAGAFYEFESAKCLFEESSSLMRRVRNGALRGEYGHPKMVPGMSEREYLARVLNIYEDCVSHHIRSVTIDNTGRVKDGAGKPVIAILGSVKPMGPRGQDLRDSLENGHENACFSIRSLTNDFMDRRGMHRKVLKQIVTWDYVNEPGISVANKFSFPSLEGISNDLHFTVRQLNDIRERQSIAGVSMENGGGVTVDAVMQAFGWDIPVQKSTNFPPSSRW